MHSGTRDTRPIERRDTDRSEATATTEADAHFTFFSPFREKIAFFYHNVQGQ